MVCHAFCRSGINETHPPTLPGKSRAITDHKVFALNRYGQCYKTVYKIALNCNISATRLHDFN